MRAVKVLLRWISDFIESNLIFENLKQIGYTPGFWNQGYEEIILTTKNGLPIKSWYLPLSGAKRVIFVLHGRGYTIDHLYSNRKGAQTFYELQKSLAANLFFFEYRGYGWNKGRASFKNTIEDIKLALQFIELRKGFTTEQIIILGHSLGGALAINLATQYHFELLALVSPLTDLIELIGLHFPNNLKPLYNKLRKNFSWPDDYFYNPIRDADKIICPTLVMHSSEDPIIPPSLVIRFFNIVSQNNKYPSRMILLPKREHLDIYELKRALDILKSMLRY